MNAMLAGLILAASLGGAVRFETRSARELLQDEARLGARLHGGYADNDGSSASVTAYGLPGERIDLLAYFNRVERGNYEVGGGRILEEKLGRDVGNGSRVGDVGRGLGRAVGRRGSGGHEVSSPGWAAGAAGARGASHGTHQSSRADRAGPPGGPTSRLGA